MSVVRPFKGLLYDPAVAGPFEKLTAPPYDVISPTDQDRYHRASPFNAVRLILGRDEPDDGASSNKYTRAASYLRSWREQGVLRETETPCLYPYELDFHLGGSRRRVRGIVAEVGIQPWGGSIIPHERTLPGPIEDRLNLLRAVRANLSPVYAVVPGPEPKIVSFLDAAMARPPDREVTDEAGTIHRLWVASQQTDAVEEALASRSLMIADGHHRYAVALAYREEMRAKHGPGPWDYMMTLLVDAGSEDPPVLPIHRLVLGANDRLGTQGEAVRDMAEVLATLRDDDLTYGSVRLEDGGIVHRVAALRGPPPTVCALHEQVLDPALDRRAGAELRFVADSVAAEEAVEAGTASVALLLPATRFDRVWDVVRSGRLLPQKSTYFWPKPRTGLVIRSFSDR